MGTIKPSNSVSKIKLKIKKKTGIFMQKPVFTKSKFHKCLYSHYILQF